MLIAHVNFTYPRGKLLSIPGQFSCIARGWGSGGVIDRLYYRNYTAGYSGYVSPREQGMLCDGVL